MSFRIGAAAEEPAVRLQRINTRHFHPTPVILSEVAALRSKAATRSKDLAFACVEIAAAGNSHDAAAVVRPAILIPMDEIEIKFRVPDLAALSSRLNALGLKQITPRTHEMNILFDLPGRPLRAKGDLLRLRKYGDTWLLTHKARSANDASPHKIRIETETRIADGEKMQAILTALQFHPVFRYEKFRAEWSGEKGHVLLDETPIGTFAEIEGPANWIDSIAQQLGITPADYIAETYAALFLAWKRESRSLAEEMTFAAVSLPTRS